MTNETVNYLTFEQAAGLVERIAERASNFNYYMSNNEKEAMADLLSNIGVNTSDIIDVCNLADNYAINAEIVTPDEASYYDNIKEDCLFLWEEDDGTHYCYRW
jgi:hypothetical protein